MPNKDLLSNFCAYASDPVFARAQSFDAAIVASEPTPSV